MLMLCVKKETEETCSQTAEKEKNPNNQTYYDAEIAAFVINDEKHLHLHTNTK